MWPVRLSHSVSRSGVSLLIRYHVEQGRGRALSGSGRPLARTSAGLARWAPRAARGGLARAVYTRRAHQCGLRAKSKTRNATLASQSGVLSQQPRSRVLEQRSSSLNPTLHNTEQRLPNKTPLCNLHIQGGLLLRKTPTEHVRAESSQCNTAQHSGSGQFPRRGCFRLPQPRSPSLLLFRAGLCSNRNSF